MANFIVIEIEKNEFAILPSAEAEVVLFQISSGKGWVVQPLPEEGWSLRGWFWGENPLEITLGKGWWQPLPEGEERKLPAEGARLGWAWALSSRGTR